MIAMVKVVAAVATLRVIVVMVNRFDDRGLVLGKSHSATNHVANAIFDNPWLRRYYLIRAIFDAGNENSHEPVVNRSNSTISYAGLERNSASSRSLRLPYPIKRQALLAPVVRSTLDERNKLTGS